MVAALAAVPACDGSYSAFHKVHAWNGKVTTNKWANFNTVEHLTDKPVF